MNLFDLERKRDKQTSTDVCYTYCFCHQKWRLHPVHVQFCDASEKHLHSPVQVEGAGTSRQGNGLAPAGRDVVGREAGQPPAGMTGRDVVGREADQASAAGKVVVERKEAAGMAGRLGAGRKDRIAGEGWGKLQGNKIFLGLDWALEAGTSVVS